MALLTGTVTKSKRCERCNLDIQARLVRKIATNGVTFIYWECPSGHAITKTPKWLPHSEVTKYVDISTLPVVEDYSDLEKCVVCGDRSTEWHHFAPRYLFGDAADNWPGAHLCRYHHMLWHQLVTPEMCNKDK